MDDSCAPRYFGEFNDFDRYFRCFNSVHPYSVGHKIVIFGFSGFEDGVKSTKSITQLNRSNPKRQKVIKYTVFDYQPKYEQVKVKLQWEEKEYREKIKNQEKPKALDIEDEKLIEEEYIHNKIEYCGITFLPTMYEDNEVLCYFDEVNERFKIVPKIKKEDESDSDDSG